MRQLPLFGTPELLGFLKTDRPAIDALGRALAKLGARPGLRRADAAAFGRLLEAWARLPRPASGIAISACASLADGGLPFRRRVILDGEGLRLENESGARGELRIEAVFAAGVSCRKASADPDAWVEAFARMAEDCAAEVTIEDRSPARRPPDAGDPSDLHDWWSEI